MQIKVSQWWISSYGQEGWAATQLSRWKSADWWGFRHQPKVWDPTCCADSCSSHHHYVLTAAELHQPSHRCQASLGWWLNSRRRWSSLIRSWCRGLRCRHRITAGFGNLSFTGEKDSVCFTLQLSLFLFIVSCHMDHTNITLDSYQSGHTAKEV